jgi:hypothetical protein
MRQSTLLRFDNFRAIDLSDHTRARLNDVRDFCDYCFARFGLIECRNNSATDTELYFLRASIYLLVASTRRSRAIISADTVNVPQGQINSKIASYKDCEKWWFPQSEIFTHSSVCSTSQRPILGFRLKVPHRSLLAQETQRQPKWRAQQLPSLSLPQASHLLLTQQKPQIAIHLQGIGFARPLAAAGDIRRHSRDSATAC